MSDFQTEPRCYHSHSKSEFLINVHIRNYPESPGLEIKMRQIIFSFSRVFEQKIIEQHKPKKNATVKMTLLKVLTLIVERYVKSMSKKFLNNF